MKPTDPLLQNVHEVATDNRFSDEYLGAMLRRAIRDNQAQIIQLTEGMCYIDGRWQQVEECGIVNTLALDQRLNPQLRRSEGWNPGGERTYRLIPLQEET